MLSCRLYLKIYELHLLTLISHPNKICIYADFSRCKRRAKPAKSILAAGLYKWGARGSYWVIKALSIALSNLGSLGFVLLENLCTVLPSALTKYL